MIHDVLQNARQDKSPVAALAEPPSFHDPESSIRTHSVTSPMA
jgi:hypothetical protein